MADKQIPWKSELWDDAQFLKRLSQRHSRHPASHRLPKVGRHDGPDGLQRMEQLLDHHVVPGRG